MIRSTPATLAIALFASCIPTVLLAAEPKDYDTWHVVSADGTAYGSIHTIKKTQADGSHIFTRESRYLANVLGQLQELRETLDCTATPSFAPISCRIESQSLSGTATVQGVVERGEFVITLKRPDLSIERRIRLAKNLVVNSCLADFLAARLNGGHAINDPMKIILLDLRAASLRGATITRLANAEGLARFSVKYDDRVGDGVWSFTPEGSFHSAQYSSPQRSIQLATPEMAANIKTLTPSDREMLTFPIKQSIPFPEQLRAITVKLTWKDVPIEELALEDSRQRIVRQSHQAGRHEVELRLERPAVVAAAPAIPVTDAALAKYLSEETYIQPQHAEIRRQAAQWTAGTQTTLDAARRLSAEVSAYLQGGQLIAETLSGPEVLACRKGKCADFSTFFASLARSIGVPTRVALGMRMMGGHWIGHMWCEVWVGQWMPIDATVDEVGGSPALLKLTHSDTVQGTQYIRWAVADSLEIEVIDVQRDESRNPHLKTGIVRETYTNADFGFRITAPDESWTLIDKSAGATVQLQFRLPGKFDGGAPQVHLVAFGIPPGMSAGKLIETRKTRFEASYKGYKTLDDSERLVGTLNGRRYVFVQDHPRAADSKIKTTEFVWTDDRRAYLLNVIAPEATHDVALPQVEALLARFENVAAPGADANKK